MPFLIRIFGGGNNNIQTLQLKAAIQELNIDPALYTIETLTCDDVNVNHYTIKYIVTWLLGGSVHFITGHIHQGLQLAILDSTNPNGSCFTMKIIIGELQRLNNRTVPINCGKIGIQIIAYYFLTGKRGPQIIISVIPYLHSEVT